MSQCIKGMNQEEIFMELTKDDLGKCQGCEKLVYNCGIMSCPCLNENTGEDK